MITRQAQISAYGDDFKLLMVATPIVMPLLIVFNWASHDDGDGHIARSGMTNCKGFTSGRSTKLSISKYPTGASFHPELIQTMRNALEAVMTRVPAGYASPAIKAYLAERILTAAAQGRVSFDELVDAAADQIEQAISRFA